MFVGQLFEKRKVDQELGTVNNSLRSTKAKKIRSQNSDQYKRNSSLHQLPIKHFLFAWLFSKPTISVGNKTFSKTGKHTYEILSRKDFVYL